MVGNKRTSMKPHITQQLEKVFGKLNARLGAVSILDYAARCPEFIEAEPDGSEFTFCNEDTQFIVRHDTDANGLVCFIGIIRVFCPTTNLCVTEPLYSIDEVMNALAEAHSRV